MDVYVKVCRESLPLLEKMKDREDDEELIRSSARKIVDLVTAANPNLNNPQFTDAYISRIIKNRALSSQFMTARSSNPLVVCCALFGVWTATPVLISRGIIGNGRNQARLDNIINFSLDLVDIVSVGDNDEQE